MSETSPAVDRRTLLSDALRALEEMQARLDAVERARTEPIAIIGVGCRFPGGADDPDAYWRLLREGRDVVHEIPRDRWDTAGGPPDGGDGPAPVWFGGFLDDVQGFDPKFFGVSPREATTMDPQQRLVLEVGWEALERAGQAPDRLAGSQTGVFIGITTNDYGQLARQGGPDEMDVYVATGSALNAASGRLAYTLGLQGPCMAVDTACSSSLVAVHLACQSLRSGECDLALAGGVNMLLLPEPFICFARWGMMAPDGRCKAFDAAADGFVRGEGCGIVVLKRLSDALADGDAVQAVIRGSAVNQDGRSSGLTVPNGPAQQAVVRRALVNAGVDPAQVGYVEAHGTGTALGDPIEVEALGAALGPGRTADRPLMIGSVKTNLGHLESASGIAGLIKVVLALQHAEIPPHLHLKERSPRIPWPSFPIVIPTAPTPWPTIDGRRIAGVSGFGFSGTNAHVVLEAAPALAAMAAEVERPLHLLTLSARSETALTELAGRFARRLAEPPVAVAADIAHTANTGRAHFAHRLAVTGESTDQLQAHLAAVALGQAPAGLARGQVNATARPKVAFLFTGQGAQYAGMGRRLYQTQPTFRAALDRCAELLRPYLDRPLLEVLFAEETADAALLNDTSYTQPALFALEWALAELWRAWGVTPTAVLGHSVGEYVAACLAGVFSLEDGLRLVAARGRLMGALPAGGVMAAVFADEPRIAAAIAPWAAEVTIAAVNGPENTVISGAAVAVGAALERLAAEGVRSQALIVSHAFHSPLLEPMLDALEQTAAAVSLAEPRLSLISNLTGAAAGPEVARPGYWRRHAREAVRFADGMAALRGLGCDTFIEIGPHPTLLALGQRGTPDGVGRWLPSLRRGRDDWQTLLESLAALYTAGATINWAGFDRDYPRRRVSLPTYPFQRERHWLASPRPDRTTRRSRPDAGSPLLGARLQPAHAPGTYIWEGEIDLDAFPFLDDHRVQATPVVPATAFMEMVLGAAAEAFGARSFALSGIEYHKALFLPPDSTRVVQLILTRGEDESASFSIYSRPAGGDGPLAGDEWALHASGRLRYRRAPAETARLTPADLAAIRDRCGEVISGAQFYAQLGEKGNQWGPAFQGVEQVWRGDGEALSLVRAPVALEGEVARYQFHPAVADACGHVLVATIPLERSGGAQGGAFVGAGIDEARLHRRLRGHRFWTYARLRRETGQPANVLVGDVQVIDEEGEIVAETIGARLFYLEGGPTPTAAGIDAWLYTIEWAPSADPGASEPAPVAPDGGWLILADGQGVGQALAETLRARGEVALVVEAGTAGAVAVGDVLSARPGERDDLTRALKAAFGDGSRHCRGIVHLWSLDASPPETLTVEGLAAAQTLACVSAVQTVQLAVQGDWSTPPRLWLVTRGAQAVGDEPALPGLAQAPLWGLGRSLALEHAEAWGGLIDLDPAASAARAALQLANSLLGTRPEDQMAFRQGARYAARLTPLRPNPAAASTTACRPDASYLITGGLGGLGLLVARWLVDQGARSLVLCGRRALPPRAEWPLATAGTRLSEQIAAIEALEAAGARIHVAAVDVADEAQLVGLLQTLRDEGWPAIRGVVHAAGTFHHAPLAELDLDALAAVMRAKVTGGWLLHRLLADAPLDFFVLFSSASAVLSSPLLGGYAAANAFLDALAHHRAAGGQAALSIDWGVWAGAGMAAQFDSGDVASLSTRGMGEIDRERGLAALGRLLVQDAAQVAVLPVDWRRWQQLYPAFVNAPFLSRVIDRTAGVPTPAPRAGLTRAALLVEEPAARQALVERYLGEQVASVLGLAPGELEPTEPLSELGLDSLMAVELKNRLEIDLGVVLSMVTFLQGPSVRQLAGEALARVAAASAAGPATANGHRATPDDMTGGNQLLADLDRLSDDQVDAMLAELLAAGGSNDE